MAQYAVEQDRDESGEDEEEQELPTMQRVAILFVALGQETSGEVMKFLSDYEIEEITHSVAALKGITVELQDKVLEEFEQHLLAGEWVSSGGMDFARGALERAVGPRKAQEILDRGMRRRSAYDFLGAMQDFDRLIAYCPDYAEGYNQRGFVSFIRQDYPAALIDLDRVIALSPRHTGALTGRALTLMALGRTAEARADLLVALALNPWLPERRFLDQLTPGPEETDL